MSAHAAHHSMLDRARELRVLVLKSGGADQLAEIAAGMRNLAQPSMLAEDGEVAQVWELVDAAERLVELADALDGTR